MIRSLRLGRGIELVIFVLAAAGPSSVLGTSPEVRFASPMHKIMIQGTHEGFPLESWAANFYNLKLARNEHEAFQVVVEPNAALLNASVSVGTLVPQDGQGPFNGKVKVWLVGYHDMPDNLLGGIYYPSYLSNYFGWWPDALLTFKNTCNINANDRVPFWVDVFTQADTPPGNYQATITVTANGCDPVNLLLNVEVWDFALPVSSSLDTAFSCQTKFIEPLYGSNWSESLHYKMFDLMLEHRLNVTELYRGDPIPFSYIQYWASKGATSFCLGKIPAVMYELDSLYAQVVAAGLLDKAYVYGYDEASVSDFEWVCNDFTKVHNRYPGLRTITTARDYTFGQDTSNPYSLCLRDAVDVWVPVLEYGRYDQAEGDALRAIGKDMWWYICCWPLHPYPNWFVECPAIEARLLMGAMSYDHKSSGFLYYNVARWLNQDGVTNTTPITTGPYTNWDPRSFLHPTSLRWACGDGCLILPGPNDFLPTIRLENIRDGLEDYEYLVMLKNLVNTITPGSTPAEMLFLAEAGPLLSVPIVNTVRAPNFTRDPDGQLAHHVNEDFQSLYSFRQELADAIVHGTALASPTAPPSIFVQPSDQTVFEGTTATYTIIAGGASPLSYQWKKNQVNLSDDGHYSGCTTATLTVSEVNDNDEASYCCVVNNPYGSETSNEVALTLLPASPPTITQQPTNLKVIPGGTVDFIVTADGVPPLSYQWQKNQANLSNGGHYAGATTATLTVSNATADAGDEANYRCMVSNNFGTTTSQEASLTVAPCSTPPVLLNGDFETFQDFNTGTIADHWTSYTRQIAPIYITYSPQIDMEVNGLLCQEIRTSYVETGGAGIYQTVTGCINGAAYNISGWTKTDSIKCRATVRCAPNGSTSYDNAMNLYPPAISTNTSWVPFSGVVIATGPNMTLFLDSQTYVEGSLDKAARFDGITIACGTPPPVIPGDYDHDNDVDADDIDIFIDCFSGPTISYDGDCEKADFDQDNDVDLTDFGAIQRCYSGEDTPGDPDCMN